MNGEISTLEGVNSVNRPRKDRRPMDEQPPMPEFSGRGKGEEPILPAIKSAVCSVATKDSTVALLFVSLRISG